MTESKPLAMANTNGLMDKSKELQKEILMEKLRSKTSQYKNLNETSKAVRMALLDKRWAVDSADRQILQKCLDSLQHCIKVSSLQSLIERLECLSRQLGLKFVVGTSGVNLFISSDMFYLEILVESLGSVKDVKIHHEGKIEQQSCEEMVASITRGDFADFTAQLEGLIAVYQLNAEKKVKCKAFSALQSLEEDLCTLRQLQSFIKDPWAQVHKSPIGFLQKRRGGHAMRLTYFVSPYELLDKEKGLQPLTTELLTLGKPAASSGLASLVAPSHTPVGYSATILLEGSTANKLQLCPIISSGQRSGKGNGPVYAPLVPQNSAMLPACFTLRLSQPMPLCTGLAKLIHATTEHLPEQTQCYFICESRGLEGCVVRSVPFTHPSHVPPLLACLRQQALFNTLIASCVRLQNKQVVEMEGVVMLEVSAVSWQHISVSLEHPADESVATLELSLSEPAAPRAAVCTLHAPPSEHVDEYVTRVLQKSHSIPVTLRSLVKIWKMEAKQMNGNYSALDSNFSCDLGGLDPGQQHHLSMICQDPNSSESKPQTDERKSKKRKSDDLWSSSQKKGKQGITEAADSESDSDNSYVNEDDNTMNSNSTNEEGPESSVSQNEFASDLELSAMDATDALSTHDNRSSDMDNSNDGEPEEMIRNSFHKSEHKRQKLKNKESDSRSSRSSASLLLDLTDGKSYMPSSVSITPIGSSSSSSASAASGTNLSSMLCLDRRPGIEIIPISSATPATLPSSITITPITSSQLKSLDSRSDKKSSKSSEERSKEKKKKRRRDDSMGPPEKVPPKQDPLTKPVSVSIKPTDGSPMRPSSPNSILRKFSPSPTHGRSVSITKSPSPSSVKSLGKPTGTSSHHSSPRHSPVQNSPKHLTGYSSPKNHSISSPKHSSSGSGKPSMSTLKSATTGSPSGKSGTTGYDLSKKISKDSYGSSSMTSRDKEKKHSSLSFSTSDRSSPKLKNQTKLKQLEITPVSCDSPVAEPLISPPNIEVNKSNTPSSQARNRKGSLSAVIDKLKSAHHSADTDIGSGKSGSSSSTNKFSDPKNSAAGSGMKVSESKNQEYMVKPSSDGMKITINKTRSKESSGSKLNYSSSKQSSPQLTPPSQGSPKTHTGLKPGVISGPASKKTQAMQSSKSGLSTSSTPPKNNTSPSESSGSSSLPKVPYSKSSSGSSTGINLSKSASKTSSGSPKNSNSDLSKIIRDREREKVRTKLMSNSEKSIFSSKSERHSSPSSSRDDVDGDRYKASKEANFLVEGLIKPLDTSKFQIPKLKNQNTPDKNSPVSQYDSRSLVNDFARTLDQNKFPFSHFDNTNARNAESLQKSGYTLNVPKPLLNVGAMSPKTVSSSKLDQADRADFSKNLEGLGKGESPQRSKDDSKEGFPGAFPMMPLDFKTDMAKGFPAPKGSSEDRKGADSCMKPPASGSVARSGATTPQEAAEMLLDFSSSSGSKVSGMVAVRPVYPASPALALQLAKSPAPSPLVAPSPHSNSPCITDDELMDEALVGPGK
ncbi:Mediator of RNA polymerase II transcription subunit 1 [Papilio machaon]|uniref:Mediator of RNA polymerase II transcription subunit 1 n=1 Tax=Papilio machaon TaxID=76193 RepID=A0A194RCM4_PAPMA|nr:Mediator of RNA polymerase II transcription subunit 1 [Papilio machaon]